MNRLLTTNKILLLALAAIAMLAVASCSTTSRIEQGDQLYTGVKKLNYQEKQAKLDADVKDQIFEAINVKPNNPLYSPYYRTPFPIGLWVYNHWDEHSRGLKGWLYKQLVAQPVLIRRVRPATRVDMINTLLRNNGYFTSTASYQLNVNKKNAKKASITYNVNVGKPHVLGQISYLNASTPLGDIIDSCARLSQYYRTGSRYCLDSLNAERISITNVLRNKGYYYFRPEYIEYVADSVTNPGHVNIQMVKAANVPNRALQRFLTNRVIVTVWGPEGGGVPDTIETKRCTLVKMEPVHINDRLIPECIRSRKGRPFRVGNMDRTQVKLSSMGIFSSIDMQVDDPDSTTADGDGLLNLRVNCTLDRPLSTSIELQGTSKSNSFIGPGLQAGVTHNNLWGGGEKLTTNITASYEWQTGKGGSYKNSDFNSYEFGLDSKLSIPRMIGPSFFDLSKRFVSWTRAGVNIDLMNRPNYFKLAQAGAEFSWEWHSGKHSLQQFTPFKLTYSKLIHKTAVFDSAMQANAAIAQSFADQFIPEISYTYTYDNVFGPNGITWTSTVTEAGNLFSGIWAIAGKKNGDKKMFGTPFSQFVKGQTQVVWNRTMGPGTNLVGRVFVGIAHAFGNSKQVPYSEQFYIGGANSVRAFTVRTIGPGKFHPAEQNANAYYDETGTFKFETNWEYRFPILGYFYGAAFIDAGNVWLLKDDPMRPGGKLDMGKFFDQLAVGTGVGIRFDMQMLVVRADLGIGIHAPYDTGKSGYYNIPKFKDGLAFHLAIGYPF